MILNRSVQSNTHSFRPDIQGLRAIAVLSVILFHLDFSFFEGGFIGVDIFFAISGFLMAQVISRDLQSGNFSFSSFYMRRIRRILPALYTTLIFSIIASWFVLFPKNFEDFTDVLAGSTLFLSNAILMNQSSGYFAETLANHPLLHMWSLSVEEQFYLFFPLLFLGLWRFSVVLQLIVLLLLSAASLVLAEYYFSISPSATFFHLPGRVFEFLIGVMAFLSKDVVASRLNRSQLIALSSLGLILILGSILLFKESTPVPSTWILIPLSGCFLVLSCEIDKDWFNPVLSNKCLVFLGGISFSLYLIHQPILGLARYQGVESFYLLSGLMLFSVPLAYGQARFIENTCRNADLVSGKVLLSVLFMLTSLFLGLAALSNQNKGIPERFNGLTRLAVETAAGSPVRERCSTDGVNYVQPEEACWFQPSQKNWVVFGDSHSVELAYAFKDAAIARNQGVWQLSFSGCSIAFGKSLSDPCNRWTADVFNALQKNRAEILGVVISMSLQSGLHGRHEDVYPGIPNKISKEKTELHWKRFRKLVNSILDLGLPVIWVRQAPELDDTINSKIRQVTAENDSIAGVSRHWWEERRHFSSAKLMKDPLFSKIVIIDPADTFCSLEMCYAIRNGVAYYRDRGHMSVSGGRILAEEVIQKFLNAK
tara:strand:+ start:60 stop:2015 length:1956 start_codon:yes stop_codon:yes gene_type:complete